MHQITLECTRSLGVWGKLAEALWAARRGGAHLGRPKSPNRPPPPPGTARGRAQARRVAPVVRRAARADAARRGAGQGRVAQPDGRADARQRGARADGGRILADDEAAAQHPRQHHAPGGRAASWQPVCRTACMQPVRAFASFLLLTCSSCYRCSRRYTRTRPHILCRAARPPPTPRCLVRCS